MRLVANSKRPQHQYELTVRYTGLSQDNIWGTWEWMVHDPGGPAYTCEGLGRAWSRDGAVKKARRFMRKQWKKEARKEARIAMKKSEKFELTLFKDNGGIAVVSTPTPFKAPPSVLTKILEDADKQETEVTPEQIEEAKRILEQWTNSKEDNDQIEN